ncbi:unnamed protein product, partial [marine sediment metagenome]
MKIKIPRLFKKKEPKNPGGDSKAKNMAKKVFGFEKPDKDKLIKSPELDNEAVIIAITTLQTDLNWVKRIL